LVGATFYEWKVIEGGKQPYAIAREDGQPIAFAGLWERPSPLDVWACGRWWDC
jgi:putative SOS response-associated peptidase YedK